MGQGFGRSQRNHGQRPPGALETDGVGCRQGGQGVGVPSGTTLITLPVAWEVLARGPSTPQSALSPKPQEGGCVLVLSASALQRPKVWGLDGPGQAREVLPGLGERWAACWPRGSLQVLSVLGLPPGVTAEWPWTRAKSSLAQIPTCKMRGWT